MSERSRIQRMKAERERRAPVVDDLSPLARAQSAAQVSEWTAIDASRTKDEVAPAVGQHDFMRVAVEPRASEREALPTDLQARFGSSLGQDVSAVRVNTGRVSSTLADLIDARAVTVGQDIHFGDGEYRPNSVAGEELIAHELVHAAQQSKAPGRDAGFTGQRFESEAVELGPRVARGIPVQVSSAPTVAMAADSKKPKKMNTPEQLKFWGGAVEEQDRQTDFADSASAWKITMEVSNVADVKGAEAEVGKIKTADVGLQKAIETSWTAGMGNVETSTLTDNHHAVNELSDYIAQAGIQSTALGDFHQHYARLCMDFDRLNAMSAVIGATGGSEGEIADAVIDSQKLTDKDRARITADVNSPDKTASGPLATKKESLRKWRSTMRNPSKDIAGHELKMMEEAYRMQAAINEIAAGLPTRSAPAEVKALNELKEKLEKIKAIVGKITSLATTAVGGYLGSTLVVSWRRRCKAAASRCPAGRSARATSREGARGQSQGARREGQGEGDGERAGHGERPQWDHRGARVRQRHQGRAGESGRRAQGSGGRWGSRAAQRAHRGEARRGGRDQDVRQRGHVTRAREESGEGAAAGDGSGRGPQRRRQGDQVGDAGDLRRGVGSVPGAIAGDHGDRREREGTGGARRGTARNRASAGGNGVLVDGARREARLERQPQVGAAKHNVYLPRGANSAEGTGKRAPGANAIIDATMEELGRRESVIREFHDKVARQFSATGG